MATDLIDSSKLEWWPSPAKLNLFLHITGRNSNGYHLLQSLFQILNYGDELAFEPRQDGQILLHTEFEGVPAEQNLIVRAAALLQKHTGTKLGANIWINKRLPMGGGIGGGSSNAATTLVALNYIWQAKLTLETLAELGLSLGADVPIFVRGKTAFAQGVGEIITPTKLTRKTYLVAHPKCHISTAEIFSLPELPRNTPKIDWDEYKFDCTQNDCQKVVTERYPEVAMLLTELLEYAPSRMTGTGACVFAVFDDASQAKHAQQRMSAKWETFIAVGVDSSPLHDFLAAKLG